MLWEISLVRRGLFGQKGHTELFWAEGCCVWLNGFTMTVLKGLPLGLPGDSWTVGEQRLKNYLCCFK